MICDNPKCQHHIPLPRGTEEAPRVEVEVPGPGPFQVTRKIVERHLYIQGPSDFPSRRFYFCGTCHHAVGMTKKVLL